MKWCLGNEHQWAARNYVPTDRSIKQHLISVLDCLPPSIKPKCNSESILNCQFVENKG